MQVICERYNICEVDCVHKKYRDWDGISLLSMNWCDETYMNVNFLKQNDVRRKKLKKLKNDGE